MNDQELQEAISAAKQRELEELDALRVSWEHLDAVGSRYARIHTRHTDKIAGRAYKARDLVAEVLDLLEGRAQ